MFRLHMPLAFWAVALAFAPHATYAASADTFDPAEYTKPSQCPALFDFKDDVCVARDADISKLSKELCAGTGLAFSDSSKTCSASDKLPAPECKPLSGRRAKLSGAGADATCTYENPTPVSGLGDYIGDCIDIKARPIGTSLKPGQPYQVTSQRNIEPSDRNLTLVEAETHWYRLGCRAKLGGEPHQLLASTMNESGALRSGYAFGALTMPYKYFVGEKSFVSQVPIGAYLGWRNGQAGSGWTSAFAFTLGSVKADTVDPTRLDAAGKPVVTGSTDVAALSLAAGVMFDVLKSPAAKPFKAGIFVGRDVVSNDPSISYRFNRKTWVALQIGYDFTDN